MSYTLAEKKVYWKKRMTEKISQAMGSIDWLYEEMMQISMHADVDPQRVRLGLEAVSAGFGQLLNAVNGIAPRTKEGVVDLSGVKN